MRGRIRFPGGFLSCRIGLETKSNFSKELWEASRKPRFFERRFQNSPLFLLNSPLHSESPKLSQQPACGHFNWSLSLELQVSIITCYPRRFGDVTVTVFVVCSRPSLKAVKEFFRFSLSRPGLWEDNNTKTHEECLKSPRWSLIATNRRLMATNQQLIATNRQLVATNRQLICDKFKAGPQNTQFARGTVRAVPVFGSNSSSGEKNLSVSQWTLNRKARFRFRFLHNGCGSSGYCFKLGSRNNGSDSSGSGSVLGPSCYLLWTLSRTACLAESAVLADVATEDVAVLQSAAPNESGSPDLVAPKLTAPQAAMLWRCADIFQHSTIEESKFRALCLVAHYTAIGDTISVIGPKVQYSDLSDLPKGAETASCWETVIQQGVFGGSGFFSAPLWFAPKVAENLRTLLRTCCCPFWHFGRRFLHNAFSAP